jgi:hypothetical protein
MQFQTGWGEGGIFSPWWTLVHMPESWCCTNLMIEPGSFQLEKCCQILKIKLPIVPVQKRNYLICFFLTWSGGGGGKNWCRGYIIKNHNWSTNI